MRYVPYHQLAGEPNIIVDGYGTNGTLLALSHWPGAGCPDELKADLSTQIAFRYLDRPDMHVEAEAVSNNHFDEDGLCGIYAILNPEDALKRRDALIDVASAGDFGTFTNRDSARIATALMAFADRASSPLPRETFKRSYPEQTEVLYQETLAILPEMLDNPHLYESLWKEQDARLERDLQRLSSGEITIEERPDIDLAIVKASPADGDAQDAEWSGGVHPMAIHNATERMRILITSGNRYALRYRYETWVVYVSRPVMPRVDLSPLADRLSQEDDGSWEFDDIEDLMPALHRSKNDESSLTPERFVEMVDTFLREPR